MSRVKPTLQEDTMVEVKVSGHMLFWARSELTAVSTLGNIHTNYGSHRNIALIDDALKPIREKFKSEPIKTYLADRNEKMGIAKPPAKKPSKGKKGKGKKGKAEPEGDAKPEPLDPEKIEEGKTAFDELLDNDVRFVGYQYDPDKLVDTFGDKDIDARFAAVCAALMLIED